MGGRMKRCAITKYMFLWNNTGIPLASTLYAPGAVIELRERHDNVSRTTRYNPVVRFMARGGADVTIAASFSGNPPA
jgi:hypothetical protein